MLNHSKGLDLSHQSSEIYHAYFCFLFSMQLFTLASNYSESSFYILQVKSVNKHMF